MQEVAWIGVEEVADRRAVQFADTEADTNVVLGCCSTEDNFVVQAESMGVGSRAGLGDGVAAAVGNMACLGTEAASNCHSMQICTRRPSWHCHKDSWDPFSALLVSVAALSICSFTAHSCLDFWLRASSRSFLGAPRLSEKFFFVDYHLSPFFHSSKHRLNALFVAMLMCPSRDRNNTLLPSAVRKLQGEVRRVVIYATLLKQIEESEHSL